MANRAISTPSLVINNIPILIVPNSLKFTEGFGEQKMRSQSAGGGIVDIVYSTDAQSLYSKVSFEVINTSDNIAAARSWKSNLNNNAISIVDQQSGFSRNFSNMALTNDYEVTTGADSVISLEFMGNAAV